MKPNYKDININAIPKHSGLILPNGEPWETSEHIMVKPAYTEKDLEGMEHHDMFRGLPRLAIRQNETAVLRYSVDVYFFIIGFHRIILSFLILNVEC